ncbi:hypothetical protein [Mycolicibacterium goodii]|uniref:hypothetical protein n=1 Tax=Mycolicibacterium goodii TaxID=134601 RepID=UPI001BDBEA5C|nr:hypothetical protein [Mycolicibacterium goodii]MBU8830853.1 hypothetical protein [Mycolicibacterium goodii]
MNADADTAATLTDEHRDRAWRDNTGRPWRWCNSCGWECSRNPGVWVPGAPEERFGPYTAVSTR